MHCSWQAHASCCCCCCLLSVCVFVYIVFMTDWGCSPGWCNPVLIQCGQCRLCSVPFGAAPELCRARLCDLCHCSALWIWSFVLLLQSDQKKRKKKEEAEPGRSITFSFSSTFLSLTLFLHHRVVYFSLYSCDIIKLVEVLFKNAKNLLMKLNSLSRSSQSILWCLHCLCYLCQYKNDIETKIFT